MNNVNSWYIDDNGSVVVSDADEDAFAEGRADDAVILTIDFAELEMMYLVAKEKQRY